MDNTIVTALITGGVTSLGSILGFIGTMNAQKKKSIEAHTQATESFKKSIEDKLDRHREEYLGKISDINQEITDMRAQSQQFQAVIEERIETLSDRVERHNSVIERTFHLEERASVLEEKVHVANHRIEDLEKHD